MVEKDVFRIGVENRTSFLGAIFLTVRLWRILFHAWSVCVVSYGFVVMKRKAMLMFAKESGAMKCDAWGQKTCAIHCT